MHSRIHWILNYFKPYVLTNLFNKLPIYQISNLLESLLWKP